MGGQMNKGSYDISLWQPKICRSSFKIDKLWITSNSAFSKSFCGSRDIVAYKKSVHVGHFPCHVKHHVLAMLKRADIMSDKVYHEKTAHAGHFQFMRDMSCMAHIFGERCFELITSIRKQNGCTFLCIKGYPRANLYWLTWLWPANKNHNIPLTKSFAPNSAYLPNSEVLALNISEV